MSTSTTSNYRTDQNGQVEIPFLWAGHFFSASMSAPNRTFQTSGEHGPTGNLVFVGQRGERERTFIDIAENLPGLDHPYRVRMHVQHENDPGATVILTNLTTGAVNRFGVARNQPQPNFVFNNLEFESNYQVQIESDNQTYVYSSGFQIAASRIFRFTTPNRARVATFNLFNPNFYPIFHPVPAEVLLLLPGHSLLFGSITHNNFGVDHSVQIEGIDNGYRAVVETSDRGAFRFTEVPLGTYRVTPQAHPEYAFEPASRLVELQLEDPLIDGLIFRATVRGGQIVGAVTGDCIAAGLAGNAGGCNPGVVQPFPTPRARVHISSCSSDNPADCRPIGPAIGSSTVQAGMNGQFATSHLPSGLYQVVVDTDLAALGTVYDDGVVPGFRIEWGAIRPNGQVEWGAVRHLVFVQNQSQRNWNFRWRLVSTDRRRRGLRAESPEPESESNSGFGAKATKFKVNPQPGQKLNLQKSFGLAKNNDDQTKAPRLKPIEKPGSNVALKVKKPIYVPLKPNLKTSVVINNPAGSVKVAKLPTANKIGLAKKLSISSAIGPKAILKLDLKGTKSTAKTGDNLIFDGAIHNVGRGTAKQVNWYLAGKVSGMPGRNDKLQKGVIKPLKGTSRKYLKVKFNASKAGKWNLRLCAEHHSTTATNRAKHLCSNVISLVINEPPKLKTIAKPKQQPSLNQLKLKPKSVSSQKVKATTTQPDKKTKNDQHSKQPNLLLKPGSSASSKKKVIK